jgi:GT2 family glycosyltransferase
MRPSEISLIISTNDRPDSLARVLRGVKRQSAPPCEVIIADDGSGMPTQHLLATWEDEIPVPLRHFRQDDEGFRKTMILNQCIAAAKGKYIVLLDGDCVPHRKFISDHASMAEEGFWVQGRRCYVRQSKVKMFSIDSTPIFQWMIQGKISGWPKGIRLPFPMIRRDTDRVGILGCNMAFWKDDAIAINGFDEEFTGWGHEDADFGVRLYHLGRKRKFVYGRAIIYHLNHPWIDRQKEEASRARLDETIQSRKVRCERGISQYLTETVKPT